MPTARATSQTSAAPLAPSSRARKTEGRDVPQGCSRARQPDCRPRRAPRSPASGEGGRLPTPSPRDGAAPDDGRRANGGSHGRTGIRGAGSPGRTAHTWSRQRRSHRDAAGASWRTWVVRGRGASRRRTSYRQTAMADGAERVGGRVTDSVLVGVGRSNWREIFTVRLYRIRRVYMGRSTRQIDRELRSNPTLSSLYSKEPL